MTNPPDNTDDDQRTPEQPALHSGSDISLNTADLFRHCREVTIHHGSEVYRLRLTKAGKLILHK